MYSKMRSFLRGSNTPKTQPTTLDAIAAGCEKMGMRIGKVNYDKGTINVLSTSTSAVHRITVERV